MIFHIVIHMLPKTLFFTSFDISSYISLCSSIWFMLSFTCINTCNYHDDVIKWIFSALLAICAGNYSNYKVSLSPICTVVIPMFFTVSVLLCFVIARLFLLLNWYNMRKLKIQTSMNKTQVWSPHLGKFNSLGISIALGWWYTNGMLSIE